METTPRCVCANNELHFWKALNHAGFSRNQSLYGRAAALAGWSWSPHQHQQQKLLSCAQKPLAPEQEPFLFHFVNLNPLINAAALDLYTQSPVCAVLPCYSFFVCWCVCWRECINLLLLLKFKFSSLFALAARETARRGFTRLEICSFLKFTAIKFLPIKHFPLGACQCFDLE